MAIHGYDRTQWVQIFGDRIKERLLDPEEKVFNDESIEIVIAAELESWPENDPDWRGTHPVAAADDQLIEWVNDEG